MGAWGQSEPGDDYYPNENVYDDDGKKLTVHKIDSILMRALTNWRDTYMSGGKMPAVEASCYAPSRCMDVRTAE